jgi:hypothetical protein
MTLADWRDVSIILLAVEAFIFGLVPAALFFAIFKGVSALNRKLPAAGLVVRSYFQRAERSTKVASERITAPFITAGATTAQVKRWQRSLRSSFRSKNEV